MKVTTTDLGRTVTIDGVVWTIWSEAPGPRNFHAFTRRGEGGAVTWAVLTGRPKGGSRAWRLT